MNERFEQWLRAITRSLPSDDRVWGEALLAELDHVPRELRTRAVLVLRRGASPQPTG